MLVDFEFEFCGRIRREHNATSTPFPLLSVSVRYEYWYQICHVVGGSCFLAIKEVGQRGSVFWRLSLRAQPEADEATRRRIDSIFVGVK